MPNKKNGRATPLSPTACDPDIIRTFTFHSDSNSAVPFVGIVCHEIGYLYLACRYHNEGKVDRKHGAVMKGDTLRDGIYGWR